MNQKSISIIGLGLIGGSLAKAIKANRPEIKISAFDKPDVLAKAYKENSIDYKLSGLEEVNSSNIIFLALPTQLSLEILEKISPLLKEDNLITDVCGVKSVFENKWKVLRSKGEYIGGHPMTGKEKGGYENSDPLLFENSVYILSDKKSDTENFKFLIELIKNIGARVKFIDPYVHDEIIAKVSHLPQLISVALVNSALNSNTNINYLDFAAGGFRDMTRIASSEFSIWDPIIRFNKDAIVKGILKFASELAEIDNLILKDDHKTLKELFDSARKGRDEIPKNTKGFISPLYDIFVFVKDEPGVLSKLTTALYNEKINIKDIELLKIREGTGGTFRLSFESEAEAKSAKKIIEKSGFKTK